LPRFRLVLVVAHGMSPGSSRCGRYPFSCQPRNPRSISLFVSGRDHVRFPSTRSRTPGL
jgi:hypothetical protein